MSLRKRVTLQTDRPPFFEGSKRWRQFKLKDPPNHCQLERNPEDNDGSHQPGYPCATLRPSSGYGASCVSREIVADGSESLMCVTVL